MYYVLALDTLSLWRWDFAWLSCFCASWGFRMLSILSFCLPNYFWVALSLTLMSVLRLDGLDVLAFFRAGLFPARSVINYTSRLLRVPIHY